MKLCAGRALDGPDLWTSDDPAEREAAKLICDRCSERAACYAGAVERGETWSVWGGEWFGAESLGMATVDELVAELLPTHGSRSSYTSGCHCSECTHANTIWIAQWRRDRAWSAPVEHAPMPEQLDLFGESRLSQRAEESFA